MNLSRPITAGGTGETSIAAMRTAFSLYSQAEIDAAIAVSDAIVRPIAVGGTGETSIAAMLTAFSLYTKAEIDAAIVTIPPGSVNAFAGTIIAAGWLDCDGSTVSRTTYADLFAAIGTIYGVGDGSTTFKIPDLRGQFIRGYDNGAGVDPDAASRTDSGGGITGDNVGTKQAEEFKAHTHGGIGSVLNNGQAGGNQDIRQLGGTTGSSGGNETRPVNISMKFMIKT